MHSSLVDLVLHPQETAETAAAGIRNITGADRHHIAVIFGTGWDGVAASLGQVTHSFPVAELPGFLPPTVKGHAGLVESIIAADGRRILAFRGRKHLYERIGTEPLPSDLISHPIRTAAKAGCHTIILTSAVGGCRPEWPDGTAVLVKDHIALFIPSPLHGQNFQQCDAVYSASLRTVCRDHGLNLPEAILAQVIGPHFETRAERNLLQSGGIDIVGMSIVGEAIIAINEGLEVLAISIITDQCGEPTSHDDVMAVVRKTAADIGPKLASVIKHI